MRILGIGDGPASFCDDKIGCKVTSIDPIISLVTEIMKRFYESTTLLTKLAQLRLGMVIP